MSRVPMSQPTIKNGCIIKVGFFMSMVFWAAGEGVLCGRWGQLVLGTRAGGRVGQLVGSLCTTFWVL